MAFKHKGLAATIAVASTAALGMAAPAASAAVKPHKITPDINRADCEFTDEALVVYQSSYINSDCFENAGGINVKIYNVDDVFTGNNGTRFTVNGKVCNDPYKDTMASSFCGEFSGNGTMTTLSIYPGQNYDG